MATLLGAVVAPSQTTSGDVVNPAAYGLVEAPAASVTGASLSGTALSGTCSSPLVIATGYIERGLAFTGSCITAVPEVEAAAVSGVVLTGVATAPASAVSARLGDGGACYSPQAVVAGSVVSGQVLSAACRQAAAQSEGLVLADGVLNGVVRAGRAQSSGVLRVGQLLQAALQANAQQASGQALSGSALTAILSAQVPELSTRLSVGQILDAAIRSPANRVVALLLNELLETYLGWVCTLDSGAVTNYSNFPFHTFVSLDGQVLGVADDGFYALSGDADDGADIDALMEFGVAAGEGSQRLAAAVLNLRASGSLRLHVTCDGEGELETHTLPVEPLRKGLHAVPVYPGRGLRSYNWKVALSNVRGADFDLNAADFDFKKDNRRA